MYSAFLFTSRFFSFFFMSTRRINRKTIQNTIMSYPFHRVLNFYNIILSEKRVSLFTLVLLVLSLLFESIFEYSLFCYLLLSFVA